MINENEIIDHLSQTRNLMVKISNQYAISEKDWDRAQTYLNCARQVDSILQSLDSKVETRITENNRISTRKLPYYFIEYDKLVKVGQSRDGGTYEHRVPKKHYDLITDRLCNIAKESRSFQTKQLQDSCDIPSHEPLIVLKLLNHKGGIGNPRRGQWSFLEKNNLANTMNEIWNQLPSN